MFAVKAVMKSDSKIVVVVGLFTSLMIFSYNLRLFERQIYNRNIDSSNPFLAYKDITTSMWNTLITMTTVGYGEFFAQSHCGRAIAIMAALWGTLNTSLLVVAMNNLFLFDSSQEKSYMLLQRLKKKDELRKEAVGALAAAFKKKILRRQKINNPEKYEHHRYKMACRDYNNSMKQFQVISRQIRNMGDGNADLENLKMGIDTLQDDF